MRFAGPKFFGERLLSYKRFPLTVRVKLRFAAHWHSGKPITLIGLGALTYTTSLPTGLVGVGWEEIACPHDRFSRAFGVLSRRRLPRLSAHIALRMTTERAKDFFLLFASSMFPCK